VAVPRGGLLWTFEVTELLGVPLDRLRAVAADLSATSTRSGQWDPVEVRRIAEWLVAAGSVAERTSARSGLNRLPAVLRQPEL
jgi:hypothetical protein